MKMIRPEHYQDWVVGDFIVKMQLGFFAGNAVKYLCRWRQKDGIADLQKMLTYILRLREMGQCGVREFMMQSPLDSVQRAREQLELADRFQLSEVERLILSLVCIYSAYANPEFLTIAHKLGTLLVHSEEENRG